MSPQMIDHLCLYSNLHIQDHVIIEEQYNNTDLRLEKKHGIFCLFSDQYLRT